VIIYDFDGVIADSEVIANAVLAEMVTELGRPTTLADCYRLYMGKRFADAVAAIEAALGSSLPEGFAARYQARTLAHLQRDLRPVVGAPQHILAFSRTPNCIASSSSPDRLAVCLEVSACKPSLAARSIAQHRSHAVSPFRIFSCMRRQAWGSARRTALLSRTAPQAWRPPGPPA
jgi:beta-phosphoglucomutase-like phosphatase (HAD superfamily)